MIPVIEGWTEQQNTWRRSFRCADFNTAFGFMTRVALAAEAMDHHPDWRNVWNLVEITLSTHSANHGAGGITALDATLAQKINEIFAQTPAS